MCYFYNQRSPIPNLSMAKFILNGPDGNQDICSVKLVSAI